MAWWTRIANIFRADRLSREIEEELESHIAEAIEQGRDPGEARQAFGPALARRKEIRDIKLARWLDSLRADAVFGLRQLRKNRTASAAAILSLGLAIGACTAAFRLVDALLLRPLPVADPDRLYVLARQGIDPGGNFRTSQAYEYPMFRRMRAAVQDQAELIAVSYADRVDLTHGSDEEMEKAYRQYVSGWMFGSFGLRPAAGRLFTESDDTTPGAHPYAVLSYDYWTRRFGRDPKVIGRTFRIGNDIYQIVGVAPAPFTGTEPGTMIDVFVPTMMHPGVVRDDWSWFRAFVRPRPGVAAEAIRDKLLAPYNATQEERARGWSGQTKHFVDRYLSQKLIVEPAAAGSSELQRGYRLSLQALSVLVALVLIIACANIANLMTAQASARAREMALRVSLGAGRGRLVQLVLVESAWLGLFSAAIGGAFAWQAAPFVVSRINPVSNPARLLLPMDWRVMAFALALTFGVVMLFGLAPALRASAVRPASALKGGDPHSRRRLMYGLIAAQVAFCFLVHLAAGLFVATLDRLASQPMGFSSERILTLDVVARRPQPPALWDQTAEHLRTVPGIETVALAGWPLLSGNGWNGFIWTESGPTEILAYFLGVSPGWTETMKIPLVEGRDFRPGETFPGVAIVNEAFVNQCFGGRNPIGKWFEKESGDGVMRIRSQVIGIVRDARYRNLREPITPTAYVPFHSRGERAVQPKSSATFIVRTAHPNPMALAQTLRREVPRARAEFRVSNIRTQEELNQQHTVRERLLAILGMFFAAVALLLAGVGLYGVLHYSVVQRRREIGIRLALGARSGHIVQQVTVHALLMVLAGSLAGLALGLGLQRYIATLLYHVSGTDPSMLALPWIAIFAAALLAAVPAVIRALRTDPVQMLRTE